MLVVCLVGLSAGAACNMEPRWARSVREVASNQGRKRSVLHVTCSVPSCFSRLHKMACPLRLAHAETIPGAGSHPNKYSSSDVISVVISCPRCCGLLNNRGKNMYSKHTT